MKYFFLLSALLSLSASAGYDSSWYKADYWSGEYPNGFSIVKKNTVVNGRAAIDQAAPATIKCALPFKANFHPWNSKRKATFVSMSKIVPLTVKNDFTFVSDEAKIDLKKGDVVEYLVNESEGSFLVRINGKEYGADQSLFENVDDVDQAAFTADEWVKVKCASGKSAWLLMTDLYTTDAQGNVAYAKGLDSWYLGFKEYGKVTDLTNKDLKKPRN